MSYSITKNPTKTEIVQTGSITSDSAKQKANQIVDKQVSEIVTELKRMTEEKEPAMKLQKAIADANLDFFAL